MASQVSGGADEYTVLLDAPNDETVESTKAGALNSNNPNQNTPTSWTTAWRLLWICRCTKC